MGLAIVEEPRRLCEWGDACWHGDREGEEGPHGRPGDKGAGHDSGGGFKEEAAFVRDLEMESVWRSG